MTIKVMAVGDVCGEPGLEFLCGNLKIYKQEYGVDFCVVNGENANVVGVMPKQINRMLQSGADVVTLGNHTWVRTEIQPFLNEKKRVLRPANYGPQCPGTGLGVYHTGKGDIAVVNLLGRFTLDSNTDNPFVIVQDVLEDLQKENPVPTIVLVDFHAEATSEKLAMGYMLDGHVSAVWGTHTHVQTSDAMVLPQGTGYITDLGMTGPSLSVLGIDPEQSIGKFLGDPPQRYNSAKGLSKMEGCFFEIDLETGHCVKAEAFRLHQKIVI